ncbi:MAG TPA: class I SAM-dependent methyltransferase [Candidatus Acidoferrales bacterium]|nr:class I SAM-dependent methyltransferase [Candidatus Acidoferrales bacterium]
MPSTFQPRFGHAAAEFERYRPNYPPELFERILAAVPSAHRERAMDLGAGTGKVTGVLLQYFDEVIAVEPDLQMTDKMREYFPRAVIRNVTAEQCEQLPESVGLVTIANALHWMEAERVFANIYSWLCSGGALAVFDRPLPKTTPAVDAIVLAELRGAWRPHRDPRLKRDLIWEEQVRTARGFRFIEETKFPNIVPMTPADYTGFWRSTSYGSAYAHTLANAETYWHDLESRFAAAAAGVMIPVDLTPTLILERKV